VDIFLFLVLHFAGLLGLSPRVCLFIRPPDRSSDVRRTRPIRRISRRHVRRRKLAGGELCRRSL
jgi:hypothetical protein